MPRTVLAMLMMIAAAALLPACRERKSDSDQAQPRTIPPTPPLHEPPPRQPAE